MMRKGWMNARARVFGLAGVGVLLAAMAGGLVLGNHFTASAASGTPKTATAANSDGATKYCQTYTNTLAKNLGVSTAKLESANVAAADATIDQMAQDGQITASQQASLKQWVKQNSSRICEQLDENALRSALASNPAVTQQLMAARTSLQGAVANALGISTATLQSDLASGKTVTQLAQERNVPISKVNDAYLSAAKTALAQGVSRGAITQAQSDNLYQTLTRAVSSGHYPLVEQYQHGAGGK